MIHEKTLRISFASPESVEDGTFYATQSLDNSTAVTKGRGCSPTPLLQPWRVLLASGADKDENRQDKMGDCQGKRHKLSVDGFGGNPGRSIP
jgi:hypothetical protein